MPVVSVDERIAEMGRQQRENFANFLLKGRPEMVALLIRCREMLEKAPRDATVECAAQGNMRQVLHCTACRVGCATIEHIEVDHFDVGELARDIDHWLRKWGA